MDLLTVVSTDFNKDFEPEHRKGFNAGPKTKSMT
jgi:hypothetical protein